MNSSDISYTQSGTIGRHPFRTLQLGLGLFFEFGLSGLWSVNVAMFQRLNPGRIAMQGDQCCKQQNVLPFNFPNGTMFFGWIASMLSIKESNYRGLMYFITKLTLWKMENCCQFSETHIDKRGKPEVDPDAAQTSVYVTF